MERVQNENAKNYVILLLASLKEYSLTKIFQKVEGNWIAIKNERNCIYFEVRIAIKNWKKIILIFNYRLRIMNFHLVKFHVY